MKDELVRAMTKDGFVNAVAVTTTGIVERARQIHKTLPTATAALGRLLTAASMMGNMQKVDDGSITLQLKGGAEEESRIEHIEELKSYIVDYAGRWGGCLPCRMQRAMCAAGSRTRRFPCWKRPPASWTSARLSARTEHSL